MKHNIANLERVAAAATHKEFFVGPHGGLYGKQHFNHDCDGPTHSFSEMIAAMSGHFPADTMHIWMFSPDTAQALLRALREARAALKAVPFNRFMHGDCGNASCKACEFIEQHSEALANLDANFDFTEESKP